MHNDSDSFLNDLFKRQEQQLLALKDILSTICTSTSFWLANIDSWMQFVDGLALAAAVMNNTIRGVQHLLIYQSLYSSNDVVYVSHSHWRVQIQPTKPTPLVPKRSKGFNKKKHLKSLRGKPWILEVRLPDSSNDQFYFVLLYPYSVFALSELRLLLLVLVPFPGLGLTYPKTVQRYNIIVWVRRIFFRPFQCVGILYPETLEGWQTKTNKHNSNSARTL